MAFIKHQISCIVRTDDKKPHNLIAFIGGYNGSHWRIASEKAIEGIENGKWQFFIDNDGKHLNVVVAAVNGKKYLSTSIDTEQPNELLNLPDCF